MFMRRPTCTIALALLFLPLAAGAPPESARVDRIVALGRLWIAVKYFHPYLAYREDIDWDKALVDAIPKVSAADNADEYRAAVEGMLAALHDPATHVLAAAGPHASSPDSNRERDPRFHLTNDGILEVRINHYQDLTDFSGTRQKLADITKEIVNARGIVLDLRADAPLDDDTQGMLAYDFQSAFACMSGSPPKWAAPAAATRPDFMWPMASASTL
jgi:hypothetical protein